MKSFLMIIALVMGFASSAMAHHECTIGTSFNPPRCKDHIRPIDPPYMPGTPNCNEYRTTLNIGCPPPPKKCFKYLPNGTPIEVICPGVPQ